MLGRPPDPLKELRVGILRKYDIPVTDKHMRMLTRRLLHQLMRCKTPEAKRLLLGVSK